MFSPALATPHVHRMRGISKNVSQVAAGLGQHDTTHLRYCSRDVVEISKFTRLRWSGTESAESRSPPTASLSAASWFGQPD